MKPSGSSPGCKTLRSSPTSCTCAPASRWGKRLAYQTEGAGPRGAAQLLQITQPGLDGWVLAARVEDGLDLRVLQVIFGDDGGARVLALHLGAFADDLDRGVGAVVAHLERVLDDEGADHAVPNALDLFGGGVPADDDYVAGLACLAHGLGGAKHTGLIGGEDRVQVGVGGQDILGDLERLVVVALARLLGDELELGVLLQAVLEALLALLVGHGPLLERDEADLPALLAQFLGDLLGGGDVVCGEDRDVGGLGFCARVDVHHGHALLFGGLGHFGEDLGVGRGIYEAVNALSYEVLQQVHLPVDVGLGGDGVPLNICLARRLLGGALGPAAHLLPEVEADGLGHHRELDRGVLPLAPAASLALSSSAGLPDLRAAGRDQGDGGGQEHRQNVSSTHPFLLLFPVQALHATSLSLRCGGEPAAAVLVPEDREPDHDANNDLLVEGVHVQKDRPVADQGYEEGSDQGAHHRSLPPEEARPADDGGRDHVELQPDAEVRLPRVDS